MTLASGTRLGPYEVLSPLGAGGMGEVYRARDTRLGRDVALKILPAEVAQDAERLARFRREAHLLASLNHPHIAAIYGLEELDGQPLLVLELVEGEDLAQRLKRGAIPVDEALDIARQIAEALEEAHERGIVHRDLKPANIKVTPDGKVKVLDFGLAKAYSGDGSGSAPDASHSPTLTHARSGAGALLGTAAYMSPEQARGKPVDKRADIWAFGVVLYEMLTGKQLFRGETVSDTLAAVLTREPEWNALPPTVPAPARRLLRLCLVRDPLERLRDIGDARLELEAAATPEPPVPAAQPSRSARLAWAIAFSAAVVAAWALWSRGPLAGSPAQPIHLELAYPRDVEPVATRAGGFAVAPDGSSVLLVGVRDGARRTFMRRFDRAEATEIPDTLNVQAVAFSPDGGSIAFTGGASGGGSMLVRLSLADRERKELAAGVDPTTSFAWGPSGIVFTRRNALWVVSPTGGEPRALTTLDDARHESLHIDPLVLPGGRTVLFSSFTTQPGSERIEAVPIGGGPRSVVVQRAITPLWSPTGHLLFSRDGAVLAAAFDANAVALRGAAVQVIAEGVVGVQFTGTLGLRLSATGTLVYLPADSEANHLVSVGRDGAALDLNLPPAPYANPRLSPDARRLVVTSSGGVETFDLARGTRARLAAALLGTRFPAWSADGKRVVFRRNTSLSWAAADGSGKEGLVPATDADFASAPGPDPDSVLGMRIVPETSGDVFLYSISGAFDPRPLVATPAFEGGPQLSPDGRFLVYQSNQSGRFEIYVGRFPALDRSWQASEGGGIQPRWNPSGREIFYRNGQRLVAVPFEPSSAEPTFGKPTPLFVDEYAFGQGTSIPNYDVAADGRFIMLRRDPNGGTVSVVLDWTEELKRILASGGVR